jgi:uncharacterized iron-regulated protein
MTCADLGQFARRPRAGRAVLLLALALLTPPQDASATTTLAPTPEALATAMDKRRIVLLGEVHDNGAQHALRVDALRRLVEAGARPAIAFEQLDRDRQAEIDRLRRDQPGDVDALAALGARNWEWRHYKPFLQLAVDYGLPIVAANLSRADAIKVSTQGWSAVFDAADQEALGLGRLPVEFVAAHDQAVKQGHCNLLPPESVSALARAQIARDITLARSLRSYAERGVVLLTGNGHARRDIGVPYWLSAEDRRDLVAIALLEADRSETRAKADGGSPPYDAIIETVAATRPDPCAALRERFQSPASRN